MGIVTHLTDLTDRVRHGEEAMGKSSSGYHCHNPIISYHMISAMHMHVHLCIEREREASRTPKNYGKQSCGMEIKLKFMLKPLTYPRCGGGNDVDQ